MSIKPIDIEKRKKITLAYPVSHTVSKRHQVADEKREREDKKVSSHGNVFILHDKIFNSEFRSPGSPSSMMSMDPIKLTPLSVS